MLSPIACLATLATMLATAAAYSHKGDGTAYSAARQMDATGQNMCEFDATSLPVRWQTFYGAMNKPDWEKYGGKDGICGKCIKVRGVEGQTTQDHTLQTIYVMIVDQCPECKSGSVDFSKTALKWITGYSWDRKQITWEFTPCPYGDTLVGTRAAGSKPLTQSKSGRKFLEASSN